MRSGAAIPLVPSAAAQVSVSGVIREVDSVRVSRSLGGGGVPGLSEAAAASGSCVFSRAQDVLGAGEVRPSPWRRMAGWPPARRAAVSVATGTTQSGVYSAGAFVLDGCESSNGEPVSASFIDPIDRMRRNVTLPPMLSTMPPATEGGQLLNVGLSSDFVVDRVLRACSIFSTPYLPAAKDGVSVPGQGSVWPARGTVVSSGALSNGGASPNFATANWGWGITDCDASFTPSGAINANGGLELSCMVSSGHSAQALVNAYLVGRSEYFQLLVLDNRAVQARFWDGSSFTNVASLGSVTGFTRVTARFGVSSVTITTDDGRSDTGSYSPGGSVTGALVDTARIYANNGAVIGGVMVSNAATGYYNNFNLNAVLYAGTGLNPKLKASPALVDRNALDLVMEIAEATCRTWWWTEDGVFQWIPGDRLLARTASTTLTSLDSLVSVGWSESMNDVFSRIVVKYEYPLIARSSKSFAKVWEGGSQTVADTINETLIAAPDNEDWFFVAAPQQLLAGNVADFNVGRGSWYGATKTNGKLLLNSEMASNLFQITPSTWKLTVFSAGEYDQKVPDDVTTTPPIIKWYQGDPLPVLRARAKTTWGENSQSFGAGPADAPEYVHEGGRWLQGYADEGVPAVGGFLADWLCSPHPRIEGLSIVHDARIQVGDVVDVEDRDEFGVRWTVLLTKVEQSIDGHAGSMSVDCFVISAASLGVTYGEVDEANAGRTYGQLDAANAGRTYGQFDTAPISA